MEMNYITLSILIVGALVLIGLAIIYFAIMRR